MAGIAFLLVSSLVAVRSGPVPPMDDTYIHLVYGRSILRGQPLQFNPGTPSSGFTSPLWLAASAAAAAAGTEWAPAVLMALSAMAGCAAVLLAGPGPAPLFLLILGPLLFHGASGMETALACLAVVLVWRRLESGGEPDLRGGLLLAGAALVRPELALLAVPLALGAGRPGGRQLAALLWPPLALGALWMAWNLRATGLPLPSTPSRREPPPTACFPAFAAWPATLLWVPPCWFPLGRGPLSAFCGGVTPWAWFRP